MILGVYIVYMRILRVFPRRTRATPDDELVRVGCGPGLFDEADEVHISVSFTWDLSSAERLVREWARVGRVRVGGPATGEMGLDFVPGLYLKNGYVITSRGCPNRCWFCSVWRREGAEVRELPIVDGSNILDDNLLACSDGHVRRVFEMLGRQGDKPEFTGGLEAARLKRWHARELRSLRPKQVFFAYDTPDDLEPLIEAGKLLHSEGFPKKSHNLRAYVLCGYPKDTMGNAEKRMKETLAAGFTPMAMLWRDSSGETDSSWRKFQRLWARPAIIHGSPALV